MREATPGEGICQEQEAKTKFVGVHPSPCSAQGYLCLSPSGPLGWRLGGLFTLNLAMKLTSRAWERDESFQLGGSPGCQPLAKVLKSGADTICPQMERQPSLIPPCHSAHHTHLQSYCISTQNPRLRSKGPWANRHTERHALTLPSSSQLQGPTCPLSLKNHGAFWTSGPPLSFHFCNSSPDSAPVLSAFPSGTSSLLVKPLETWKSLVLLQGKPLSSEVAFLLVL